MKPLSFLVVVLLGLAACDGTIDYILEYFQIK